MKKRYLLNEAMSDPNWINKKRQEFFALRNMIKRFQWGSAYLPEGCTTELYHIGHAIERMEDPIKFWVPEKPRYIKCK